MFSGFLGRSGPRQDTFLVQRDAAICDSTLQLCIELDDRYGLAPSGRCGRRYREQRYYLDGMIGVLALFVHGHGPSPCRRVSSSACGLLFSHSVCLRLHGADKDTILETGLPRAGMIGPAQLRSLVWTEGPSDLGDANAEEM
jgi:hypothetical protein